MFRSSDEDCDEKTSNAQHAPENRPSIFGDFCPEFRLKMTGGMLHFEHGVGEKAMRKHTLKKGETDGNNYRPMWNGIEMNSRFLHKILSINILYSILFAQTPYFDKSREGFLVFHPINTDADGFIVSWYGEEPGEAFDFVIKAAWTFWDTMRTDMNGLPYYMNHQVWRPGINDRRGIGGDQLAMALSSWSLLYQYSGDEKVKENMKFIADYYLAHSLSPHHAEWPDIPFPYNTLIYSGEYDGDMILGAGFAQPDKAGSFGDELVTLYKMTRNPAYLNAAVGIANTLAKHVQKGDENNSPLPFKVDVFTGEIGRLKSNTGDRSDVGLSSYTTNWVGTLQLFEKLIALDAGNIGEYHRASVIIVDWMKRYPLDSNKWGPFFEDIPGWSDTQTNAVTFARYIMEHPASFPDWRQKVKHIFDWVYEKLGNDSWLNYGVRVVNEQTVYQTPGNSHTSRQASAELLYASLSGDRSRVENAVRQLLWATYMVDTDGKNCYPRDEVWLTDGYGDYVRHFLRAMAAKPELAPAKANHILHSTSVVSQADYAPDFNKTLAPDIPENEIDRIFIFYRTFDRASVETVRMTARPSKITIWNDEIPENRDLDREGWTWQSLPNGGILKIRHDSGNTVKIWK